MLFQRKASVSWLIVGLGNPGGQYDGTRHNAGFAVADELARRGGFAIQRVKFRALTGTASIGGQGALVMKPTTYMNLSGEAVGEAARFTSWRRTGCWSSPTTWTCPWASCACAPPAPPGGTTG